MYEHLAVVGASLFFGGLIATVCLYLFSKRRKSKKYQNGVPSKVRQWKISSKEDKNLPPKIGDRVDPRRPIKRVVRSFFMEMKSKFEDIELIDGTQIPTTVYLECCRSILPIFGMLHTAMA